MWGGYCALPLPRGLTCSEGRLIDSTAAITKCTKSFCGTHCLKSGGSSIGVCRSTFTNRSAILRV